MCSVEINNDVSGEQKLYYGTWMFIFFFKMWNEPLLNVGSNNSENEHVTSKEYDLQITRKYQSILYKKKKTIFS